MPAIMFRPSLSWFGLYNMAVLFFVGHSVFGEEYKLGSSLRNFILPLVCYLHRRSKYSPRQNCLETFSLFLHFMRRKKFHTNTKQEANFCAHSQILQMLWMLSVIVVADAARRMFRSNADWAVIGHRRIEIPRTHCWEILWNRFKAWTFSSKIPHNSCTEHWASGFKLQVCCYSKKNINA